MGGLVEGTDGAFYGTTALGGVWSQGTVFRLAFVDPALVGTKLAITPPTVAFGDSTVTLSAQLSRTDGGPVFPATVTFLLNGHVVGSSATHNVVGEMTGKVTTVASLPDVSLAGLPFNAKVEIGVKFSGDAVYAPSSANTSFVLATGLSKLQWNTPTPIAVGTPLSAVQLNATASTPGTFSYTPGPGTVLSLGPHTLSVTFTPFNTNYNTVTVTIVLAVKADPGVVWTLPAEILTTTPLSALCTATANVPGRFSYVIEDHTLTCDSTKFLNAAPYGLLMTFNATDLATYMPITISKSVVVKSPPTVPTLTYPANGAASADMSQSIMWTTVSNVQWYYLYIGTTAGAKDLVDTGGLLTTSYLASGLPAGRTLYARIWAQVGGVWRYTDSTFTAAASGPVVPTLTYPANGAVAADLSQPITWTTVTNPQWYYLYVGTTPGAKDLIDTGGLHATSYLAPGLPTGQTLYARVWALVGGLWRYTDSTFTAAAPVPVAPTLTYPANGASAASMSQPITWTTVPNAQWYYLYVGTTPGAKDLIDTGGLHVTSYLASGLPAGQTLYARIWAQVGGLWRYTDSTFKVQ